MKTLLTLSIATMMAMPVMADINTEAEEVNSNPEQTISETKKSAWFTRQETSQNEFGPTDNYESGFVTGALNKAIEKGMEKADQSSSMSYGRKVTDYVSAPKFGGYVLAGYYWDNKDGNHSGDGFKQKNARLYVSGTILKDFSYLVQVQFSNASFHMKDYYIQWNRWKEFQIKAGQFIRVFGYECPYNPFEFYEHSYAQISQKLCGQADRVGQDNGGGRDQGIQLQGDLFPIGKDKHRLLHYQVMVSNGQTINSADKNSQKDITGCIAFQPVSGLRLAFWGWTGYFTGTSAAGNEVTVSRNRYMASIFYDKNDWTFRTEYAHSQGGKVTDVENDQAQGWYATLGIPCNKWLKTYLKYDAYEDDATLNTLKSIYSVSAHIALHKNLYFLPSFGYVHDKTPGACHNYCEIFAEMGFRF